MADISQEIAAFQSASRGEDVRDSLISMANKLNAEVSTAAASVSDKMSKSTYDADNDGIVDNSEKLEGHPASYFATADSVSGKMDKSVYDSDNDGVVDSAESVPWSGVQNKPTTISGYGITDAYTKTQVDNKVAGAISSVYKPGGSVAFASFPALSSTNLGYVYNVTDDFTTTADFVEGAGNKHPAGTNVVIVDTGNSVYKYDVLAGFVDLSDYAKSGDVDSALAEKVDKETGKGLSTNDYTTAEKNKLSGIEAGAQVNVKSDLNAVSGDAQILNNPFSVANGMLMVTFEA